MPRHNLYQMMLNCEKWRSSQNVGELSAAGRGVFIDLLTAAWLTDDCTLPMTRRDLIKAGRPDSEAQWDRLWEEELKPRFRKRGKRLYNPQQMEEFEKANHIYKVRRNARDKGDDKGGDKDKLKTDTTNNVQLTSPQPTSRKGSPTLIADSIQSLGADMEASMNGSRTELRQMVGETSWGRAYGFFLWAHDNAPEMRDWMDRIRSGSTEELREAKGCTEIKNPGAWIRKECKSIYGTTFPRDSVLNQQYKPTKEL